MTRAVRARQVDITTAWAACAKKGVPIARTEIRPDGTIVVHHIAEPGGVGAESTLDAMIERGARDATNGQAQVRMPNRRPRH
jgi:hypothetical protein